MLQCIIGFFQTNKQELPWHIGYKQQLFGWLNMAGVERAGCSQDRAEGGKRSRCAEGEHSRQAHHQCSHLCLHGKSETEATHH